MNNIFDIEYGFKRAAAVTRQVSGTINVVNDCHISIHFIWGLLPDLAIILVIKISKLKISGILSRALFLTLKLQLQPSPSSIII